MHTLDISSHRHPQNNPLLSLGNDPSSAAILEALLEVIFSLCVENSLQLCLNFPWCLKSLSIHFHFSFGNRKVSKCKVW